jgi:hypothetical protein
VCAQPRKWCVEHLTEAALHIPAEDDVDEYVLTDKQAEVFSTFAQGEAFKSILISLDTDSSRVHLREKRAAQYETFLDDRHANSSHAVGEWWGCTAEDLTPFPTSPMPSNEWMDIMRIADDGEDNMDPPEDNLLLFNAIKHITAYIHIIHWKMDMLRASHDRDRLAGAGGRSGLTAEAELKAKFPFLGACNPNVWTIPAATNILQLARSAAVPHATLPHAHAYFHTACVHVIIT